jgi:hypothetical protein
MLRPARASKQVRRVVEWKAAEKLYEAASASLRRVEEECSAESARVLRGPRPAADAFLYARATTVPWVWCQLGDIARFLLILCLPATPNLRSSRWPSCPVRPPHALLAKTHVRARISVSQTVLSTLPAHARYGSMQLDEPARGCLFCNLYPHANSSLFLRAVSSNINSFLPHACEAC